jgi:hypothetical protein
MNFLQKKVLKHWALVKPTFYFKKYVLMLSNRNLLLVFQQISFNLVQQYQDRTVDAYRGKSGGHARLRQ